MKTNEGILSWIVLALVGLTSAILCIAQPPLRGWLNILYVGTAYGLLLVVYFAVCRGVRSIARLVTMVGVSAVAWPTAYFGAFAGAGYIPGGMVHEDPAFPLIAFGGVLGGIVLLVPAILVFRPISRGRTAALTRALLGVLLSGIVGGIAWNLGPTLGATIWGLLPTAPLPQPESYSMSALFFVWQPVMALFIGWATSERRKVNPIETSETHAKAAARMPQTNGGLRQRAFGLVLVSLLALSLTRIIPVRLRLAHREHVAASKTQRKPLYVDLAVAQPMNEDEALILKNIGDYQPGHAVKSVEPVSYEKGSESPPDFYFSTLYTKAGEMVPQWPIAPKQYISVVIQQYPNGAWAQYFAEYPPRMYISPDNSKQHALVTQFNNKVRSDQLDRSRGQTWYPLYYMWQSGDCVITVEYHTSDENLELVRAYLEKYPSSIR